MGTFNFNFRVTKSGAPYVTLSSFGIAFNDLSQEKLKRPEEIIIGFDEDKHAIGIKAYSGEKDVPTFTFASKVRHNWVRIGCKDFMRYVASLVKDQGIDFLTRGKSFIADFDDDTQTLIIVLDKEHMKTLPKGDNSTIV